MLKIGKVVFKSNIFLAPMAGISNNAFRDICKKFNAGLVCSEMISDIGIIRDNKKTDQMIKFNKLQRPISIQIFGNTPKEMAHAAIYIEKHYHPDIIDINCGCPVKKVAISKKAGSYLMKEPLLIYEIVKEVVDSIKTPVTVKIRSGWDENNVNALEVSKLIEKAGASAIIVHPRTRKQEFSGFSDWNIIKQIKQNIKIPVIGSGDIKNCYDAKKMFETTKCDAVMIGRGSIGNPWIFNDCYQYIYKGIEPKQKKINEIKRILIKHLILLNKYEGEKKAILLIRPHINKYFNGIENHKEMTKKIILLKSIDEIKKIIKNFKN